MARKPDLLLRCSELLNDNEVQHILDLLPLENDRRFYRLRTRRKS